VREGRALEARKALAGLFQRNGSREADFRTLPSLGLHRRYVPGHGSAMRYSILSLASTGFSKAAVARGEPSREEARAV